MSTWNIVSEIVNIQLGQIQLGCNEAESLQLIRHLVQLHYKQAEREKQDRKQGFVLDDQGKVQLTRTIQHLSAERGVYQLSLEASQRYGDRYTTDYLTNIGATYSSHPSFLDPVVVDLWKPRPQTVVV